MAQEFTNGAMDDRIVRLNEFKGVKMAQLSKGKRPAAKFNKEVANYLLTNWDNVEALKTCLDAMRKDMPAGCDEVMNIYLERISALELKQAEVKPEVNLTDGERSALRIFFNSIESENGFHMDDVHENAKQYGYSKKAMVGYSSALSEKGLLYMYADMDCYFDGELTAAGMEIVKTISDEQIIRQEKAERKRIREEKSSKRETEATAKELANKRKSGAPKTRKVGDRHPKHPWIWTEYKKGKFDWRIDPALKQKPGKKAGVTANQSKKKKVAGKAEKAEPAAAPKLTLTELLAKPTPSGLSKAQQNVIKAFKKGFRLRKDGNVLWLTDAAGNNERIERGVLEALQRRYKIDYIPNSIWRK